MKEYITQYSTYTVDEKNHVYMRKSLSGEERLAPSPRLVDGNWIEYKSISVLEYGEKDCLHIMTPDAIFGVITSPIEKVIEVE